MSSEFSIAVVWVVKKRWLCDLVDPVLREEEKFMCVFVCLVSSFGRAERFWLVDFTPETTV